MKSTDDDMAIIPMMGPEGLINGGSPVATRGYDDKTKLVNIFNVSIVLAGNHWRIAN
jgi:hypothetical protein